MRSHILKTLFFCFLSSFAYAQNIDVEKLMVKRLITESEISYNFTLLIPRLYTSKADDTINALISYYEKNFGTAPEVVPFIILNDISRHTFKEALAYHDPTGDKEHTVTDSEYYEGSMVGYYLLWYKDYHNDPGKERTRREVRDAYDRYFAFIVAESRALLANKTLTPVEKWILSYFIDPKEEKCKELSGHEYDSSLLQKSWIAYHKDIPDIAGFGFSATTGVWSPTGKLSIIGNHPYIGYTLGGKTNEHFLFDLRTDFRFLKSSGSYIVPASRKQYTTSYFFGMNIGFDMGYELFRHKRHEFDVLGGVAYEYMQTLSGDVIDANDLKSDAGTFKTVNLNAGLAYRFFLTTKRTKDREKSSYIALQARYNLLFYNNNGGSDFHGGAWTIGLSYGYYSRSPDRYKVYY